MRLLGIVLLTSLAVASCGDDCEKPKDADACEACGYAVRPSPGGSVECEPGETEIARIPFGIEGAVCCDPDG